jgi:hypothetical protein
MTEPDPKLLSDVVRGQERSERDAEIAEELEAIDRLTDKFTDDGTVDKA